MPTIKYEKTALDWLEPLAMYLEKSGTFVVLRSPLNGLSNVDDEAAAESAGDELMARAAAVVVVVAVAVVAAAGSRSEDRARARDTVERGAIAGRLLGRSVVRRGGALRGYRFFFMSSVLLAESLVCRRRCGPVGGLRFFSGKGVDSLGRARFPQFRAWAWPEGSLVAA